jgi:hypothetical protein
MVKLTVINNTELSEVCKDNMNKELNIPKNVSPSLVLRCCDARSEECGYSLHVQINNGFMTINKVLCLYAYRNNK